MQLSPTGDLPARRPARTLRPAGDALRRAALAALLLGAASGSAPAQIATPQVAPAAPMNAVTAATPPEAKEAAPVADLVAALHLPEVLAIMRSEGLDYGETLESDLFPGRGGLQWRAQVEQLYSVDRMQSRLIPTLERELGALPAGLVAQTRDFFRSDLGQRIVGLENSAREAQLDEEVKTVSQEQAAALRIEDPARYGLLRQIVSANDLVEANVVGALNANAAFYFGLNQAGAFDEMLSEAEVLSDVAGQEEGIRAETESWIDSYLSLAYRPLSDEELTRYLEFSQGPAGQALNRAMFAAYDVMFTDLSRELGRSAARYIAGQDL